MNKNQLITLLSQRTNLQKKDCNLMVDSLFDIIYKNTLVGESTCIGKMGKFYYKEIKAHFVNNVKFNRKFFVPNKILPIFKPSQHFKRALY